MKAPLLKQVLILLPIIILLYAPIYAYSISSISTYRPISTSINSNSLSLDNTVNSLIDIKTVKSLTIGSSISTQGSVNVEPNILGSNILYIQDTAAGIKISFDQFPNVHFGDFVKVNGILSESNNEKYIKLIDITKIGTLDSIDPVILNIADITPSFEGQLVQIQGSITNIKDKNFVISQNNSNLNISLNDNIQNINPIQNHIATIKGILVNNNGFTLLPRYSTDIKIESIYNLANTGSSSSIFYGLILGIIIIFSIIGINYQKRIEESTLII